MVRITMSKSGQREPSRQRNYSLLVLGCALWFGEIDAGGLERLALVGRDQKLTSISSGEMETRQPTDRNTHLHKIPPPHTHTNIHSEKSISQC